MLTYLPARGRYTAKISGSGIDGKKAAVACKDIPGVTFRDGSVKIPADPRLLEMVAHHWDNNILISKELQAWYKRETDAERKLVELLAREDASLEHPNSNILHPYQRVGVNYLVNAGGGLLCDDMGLGKQQPVDTSVLTPSGWRVLGGLQLGDAVIGSDGKPTLVTGIYPQGVKPSFRVYMSDGSSVEAGPEHLWLVSYRRGGRKWQELELTTEQLANRPVITQQWSRANDFESTLDLSETKLYLPMLSGIPDLGSNEPRPIDPYTLGALLANGCLHCGTPTLTVNTADAQEVIAYVSQKEELGAVHAYGQATHINILSMTERIRSLNLDVSSREKFIPRAYFNASGAQRKDLLHGLMDGDGSISKTGNRVTYHSCCQQLARDVQELVESLGGIASIKEYSRKEKPTEYHVRIRLSFNPFRMHRKGDRYKPGRLAAPCRTIQRVEYVREVESVCIAVDAPDHLYVTEHCILTHNTAQSIISVDLSRDNDRVLVICPNAVKHQWREEIEKWSCLNHPVHTLEWATREACMQSFQEQGGWVIANYYALQRFWVGKEEYKTGFDVGTWDWVIIDEGHRLKNRKTRSFHAASLLSFAHLAILTGTPMGNDPSEMWALLHLLDPKKYSSYWRFFEMYVEYMEDHIFGTRTILGTKNPKLLRTDLAPRMVQRRKEDVLPQLPRKQYQTLRLDMDKAQRKYYVQMLTESRLALENGEELEAWSALAVLVRLRQILSTPANFDLPDVSTKLDAAMELITSTSRRVVVYSIYRKTVFSLCARLDKESIPNVRIIGGMSGEERHEAQRRVNAAEAQVLVATIRAGGTGLNLQGASTAIFVDEEWNPLEQRQAEDRLHRLGQTETVHIIRLCCPGTVDDLVMEILLRKKKMHDAVFAEALQREFDRFLVTSPTISDLLSG
jgi:superfamily II DNA or RNA helicase